MKAYVFPGQGAQFSGMGKDLYENSEIAKELFDKANEILGFDIKSIMFEGSAEDLKQTKVTQPAVFLHSVILAKTLPDFKPEMVAGHSLGEISALVANETLDFESGLKLVYKRALAMQAACEANPSTMAAILGLEDKIVEDACAEIDQDKAVSCSQILTYKTYKYNNILSVVIISSIQATSKWVLDYNIYNIDLTSGKEIKYSDMVSTLGYDNDTLLDKEKELLKNKMNELWGTDFDLNTLCFAEDKNCYNIANKMLETSINDGSVLYFVNDNGNLNILVVPYADFVQDGNINKYLIEVTK